MTVFVVVVDDANEHETQIPAVFASSERADRFVRDLVGTMATRIVVAPDYIQYVAIEARVYVNVYRVTVRDRHSLAPA